MIECMKRISIPQFLFPAAILLGLSGLGLAQTTVKQAPARPTTSIDGKDLYHEYCAVCHGADGKGAGPAAAAMKKPPSDLTRISRGNNGHFPDERMMRILTGEESVTAHGSKDMPTWGAVFNNMTTSVDMVQMRLHALVSYLEKLQAK